MTEKKQEEKKSKNNDSLLIIFMLMVFAFIISLILIATWSEANKLNYEAALTPEERQQISEERQFEENVKELQRQANEKASAEFWRSILIEPSIPIILVPFFSFLGLLFGFLVFRRGYW